MGRILAIDYGRKRVGLAVTDELQIIASALDTVPSAKIFEYLADYFRKEQVELVVVGEPRQMNNLASEAVKYIDPFVRKFRKTFPDVKLERFDERFTSKLAMQTMIDAGLKKKDRKNKATVDRISAVILLQSFMHSRQHLKH